MLKVIHAGWIIPIRPKETILKNHSLIIQDSRIIALIPTTDWIAPSDNYESIDCTNDVLLPGIVNTQAGASLSLLRGIDPQQEPSVTRISSYLRESIYSLGPLEEEEQRRLARSGTDGLMYMNDIKFFVAEGPYGS